LNAGNEHNGYTALHLASGHTSIIIHTITIILILILIHHHP
jgi:hypothetical protein